MSIKIITASSGAITRRTRRLPSTVTLRLKNGLRARKKRSVDIGDRVRRARAASEFSLSLSLSLSLSRWPPEEGPPSFPLGSGYAGDPQPQWEEFGEWHNQTEILDTEVRDIFRMRSEPSALLHSVNRQNHCRPSHP